MTIWCVGNIGHCFHLTTTGKPGPKGPSQELIHAIVELKSRNPRFGYPRIARIISKTFGIEIDRNVVRRVLAKYYHPEEWWEWPFLVDFPWVHERQSMERRLVPLRVDYAQESLGVLVVMDQFTRRIIGFAVYTPAMSMA